MHNKLSVLIAAAAIIITIAGVWYTDQPAPSDDVTWEDVLAEAEAGGYRIITTSELAELYQRQDDDLLLVDTRQEWEFQTGHIAGAVNFSMEPTWWERWRKAGDLEHFLGPDKDRTLVFY
ncbi:MAG: rhodanese-like domain-containing protein [Desulfotignum sp.]|nr:rhodanese-like domain-containing protein [Desulfotignum sp.]